MTLFEISESYASSAGAIRLRITELRLASRREEDDEIRRALLRRIAVLEPLLRETRELAVYTAHYYDRGVR
ncbi:MAG: hypothetical protein RRY97_07730 [Oscillibacter sp.]